VTHKEILKEANYALFANFKAKNRTNWLKKNEKAFQRCVLESHFTSLSGLGGFILSKKIKKSKSLYPTVHTSFASKVQKEAKSSI
jgi:hypothetical protein